MSTPQPTIIAAQLCEWAPFMPSHARDLLDQAAASLDGRTEPCDPVLAERRACAAISPNGLNISAAAMPHEVWAKYRDAILARGTGDSTPRTCRCGPDGCADSACPGRAPAETPSAWDVKALDTARTILAIEGNDRGQLTARVQLAVLDAMRWVEPNGPAVAPSGRHIPPALVAALRFYAQRQHFVLADSDAWDTVSGEPANFWEDEANTATVEDGSIARIALEGLESMPTQAAVDVLAERRRQIEAEGWTPDHDDEHYQTARAASLN